MLNMLATVPKKILLNALAQRGLTISHDVQRQMSDADRHILEKVMPFTMTSSERISAVISAVNYLEDFDVKGDIVECGVWKGGSSMAAALALLNRKSTQRTLYLYDTFEGMSEPGEHDIYNSNKKTAMELMYSSEKDANNVWCYSSIEEVRQNLYSIQYPKSKMIFVQGKVEDTIPATMPSEIALLRLDTDFYSSTKHELEHLFPRLVRGGILILDDYGAWAGARQATDEYLREKNVQIFLNRIDNTGRLAVRI